MKTPKLAANSCLQLRWTLISSLLLVALLVFPASVASFSISSTSPASTPATDQQFPTRETSPQEVLEAHLEACRNGELDAIYHLFSRARKLEIDHFARRDARETEPCPQRKQDAVVAFLASRQAESLLHHQSQILSLVGDPVPTKGRLPKRVARVKVVGVGYFVTTLTQQSGWDGKGDPRDCDGYEKCWFVWDIQRDGGNDNGDEEEEDDPVPQGGTAKKLLTTVY